MKGAHVLLLLLLLGAFLVLPNSLSVAAAPQAQRPPDGGTREVLISILIPSLPDAPFSATVSTEWIRQLADGTTITVGNRRAIARDRKGRIFQERRLLVPNDGKHESGVTQIEISDPVAHEFFICVPQARVCQVEFFSAPNFVRPPPPAAATRSGYPTMEDLGKQAIAGVDTVGTRETAIIETGAIGNDGPLMVRREFWYSRELGVNLVSKVNDPRVGIQNFEVSDIVRGEPDMKLFALPSQSRVIDLREPPGTSSPSTQSPN